MIHYLLYRPLGSGFRGKRLPIKKGYALAKGAQDTHATEACALNRLNCTLTVFKCKIPSACPGARGDAPATGASASAGDCSAGFGGVLCSSCKAGWYRLGEACTQCEAEETGRMQLAMWAGLLLLGLVVLLGGGLCLAQREAKEQVSN